MTHRRGYAWIEVGITLVGGCYRFDPSGAGCKNTCRGCYCASTGVFPIADHDIVGFDHRRSIQPKLALSLSKVADVGNTPPEAGA